MTSIKTWTLIVFIFALIKKSRADKESFWSENAEMRRKCVFDAYQSMRLSESELIEDLILRIDRACEVLAQDVPFLPSCRHGQGMASFIVKRWCHPEDNLRIEDLRPFMFAMCLRISAGLDNEMLVLDELRKMYHMMDKAVNYPEKIDECTLRDVGMIYFIRFFDIESCMHEFMSVMLRILKGSSTV